LRAAGQAAEQRHLAAQVGRTSELLMETERTGRTPHFALARTTRPVEPGSSLRATIGAVDGGRLVATPVS